MSCLHLLFCLDYCLYETLSSLECLSFTLHVIFPLVRIQKSRAFCDNCLVYSVSLVSNNYLGSNNCSVENNFHFRRECLVSYCSSVKTTVCMIHYPVENVHLYTSLHFPIVSNQKSMALIDDCVVYSISLVSNNYLGSNNCSVENNFHLLVNVLFTSALLFRLLSVWNIIQFRMYIFTLHVIFSLVLIQKKRALCDNCLVYITSLVSNNYLGSNNCSVENNFHFTSECLVSYCSSI